MARVPRVADEAVRDYLEALQDPNTAVDWEQVEDLATQIAETDDPVQRVLLRGEWRRASDPETYLPQLEADFIAYAKQWAETNRVTADDFYYEGVPLEVLREAGLHVSEDIIRESEEFADDGDDLLDDRAESSPAGGGEGGDVSFEPGTAGARILEAMGTEPFTINDLVERTGASRTTVRSTIERLVDAGRVTELPPLDTGTAGRAPRRYQLG